eukprot:gnl/TRDRNA2_/TRDRNA2_196260_c0_seq1.p1 gnl/TRDRNA2_/TRDRNA2_196260_c0~~gnl/TRDRNA2_/TRDRNA2_196260_c0_seq1.p1  ORF type:complete len:457 (+),score=93.60 gnl/TRDRNA2_/TRDRNA2_196260_c0_seq1:102-1472(+)
MVKFPIAPKGPEHIQAEPTKTAPPDKMLVPGAEMRPFSEDEVKNAFNLMDLDKNKFVGAIEIKHILNLIGEEATDAEIDEMIRMCDTEGSGQVSFEQLYKLMSQPPPPPRPKMSLKPSVLAAKGLRTAGGSMEAVAAAKKKTAGPTTVKELVIRLAGTDKIRPSQIKKIYKRFQEIDLDGSGEIDYEEFLLAIGVEDSPAVKSLFQTFDMDKSGTLEVKEFIVVLSRYTAASKSEKLKFAFQMFDEDGSGFIEREELLKMLYANFMAEAYSRDELEDRADQVLQFLGLPSDGKISYEDFLTLSGAKNGLVYPVQQEQYSIRGNVSINAMITDKLSDASIPSAQLRLGGPASKAPPPVLLQNQLNDGKSSIGGRSVVTGSQGGRRRRGGDGWERGSNFGGSQFGGSQVTGQTGVTINDRRSSMGSQMGSQIGSQAAGSMASLPKPALKQPAPSSSGM